MRENTDQNDSQYEHFLHSDLLKVFPLFKCLKRLVHFFLQGALPNNCDIYQQKIHN